MVVTEDGGDSWRDLYFPYQNYGIAVASFSPDFSNDRTLVIGVRERRSNGEIGIGVWKSQDFGKSWDTLMSQGGGSYWITVLVPPSYPRDQSIFAGSRNRVFRPLRRSADVSRAGRRQLWMGERVGKGTTSVVSVVASPNYNNDETLFAATSTGVYMSQTGGLGWHDISQGLSILSVVSVQPSPNYSEDRTIFAATLGGDIWKRVG